MAEDDVIKRMKADMAADRDLRGRHAINRAIADLGMVLMEESVAAMAPVVGMFMVAVEETRVEGGGVDIIRYHEVREGMQAAAKDIAAKAVELEGDRAQRSRDLAKILGHMSR